MTLLVVIYFC